MISVKNMREEAIAYLSVSRRYVYGAAAVFLLFGILGFVLADHLTFLNDLIRDLISGVSMLHGLDVGLYIFVNNTQSAFIGLVAGIFFGIFPLFNIVLNGTVIGYVLAVVSKESSFLEVWKLLPHGIFELPAIFISLGLGLKLGVAVFSKNPIITLKQRLYYSLLVFVFFVLPLLAVAAIIEGSLIELYE
jgi:stage II sporulation protein M